MIVESIAGKQRDINKGDKKKHARQLSQKRAKSKTNVQAGGKKNTRTENSHKSKHELVKAFDNNMKINSPLSTHTVL